MTVPCVRRSRGVCLGGARDVDRLARGQRCTPPDPDCSHPLPRRIPSPHRRRTCRMHHACGGHGQHRTHACIDRSGGARHAASRPRAIPASVPSSAVRCSDTRTTACQRQLTAAAGHHQLSQTAVADHTGHGHPGSSLRQTRHAEATSAACTARPPRCTAAGCVQPTRRNSLRQAVAAVALVRSRHPGCQPRADGWAGPPGPAAPHAPCTCAKFVPLTE